LLQRNNLFFAVDPNYFFFGLIPFIYLGKVIFLRNQFSPESLMCALQYVKGFGDIFLFNLGLNAQLF
jgi:hypothetical protein